jgi:Tfp pilus assembly protein FimV
MDAHAAHYHTTRSARHRHRATPRDRTSPPRSRRTARTHVAEAVFVAGLAVFLIAATYAPDLRQAPSQPRGSRLVRVSSADTAWGIARDNRLPDASVADTLEAIRALNPSTNVALLQPGTMVAVPTIETVDSALASR